MMWNPIRRKLFPFFLSAVCLIFLNGCGTKNFSPSPDGNPQGQTILKSAYSQLGKSYRYGGASPKQGFDCSGLVYWSYRANGISVPRTTRQQASAGISVPESRADHGDIVVFRTGFRSLHTGLYAGNNKFIHSPRRGSKVRVESMTDPYWKGKLVAVRRVYRSR